MCGALVGGAGEAFGRELLRQVENAGARGILKNTFTIER